MARVDQQQATCELRTRREGLLAAVGHDLRFAVTRFAIDVESAPLSLRATFEVHSIQVVCAVVAGRDAHGALTDANREEINGHAWELLKANDHPNVVFELTTVTGAGNAPSLTGALRVAGQSQPVTVTVTREGDLWCARATVNTPSFGIRPFRAALGALRVHPDVEVQLRVPCAAVPYP